MPQQLLPGQPAPGVPSFLLDMSAKTYSPTSILDEQRKKQEEQDALRAQQEYSALMAGSAGKPLIAQSPGQAASEIWNVAANAVVGAATDYLDLAAGVGDVARATVGNKPWGEVFNDADNPWVRWRRNTFRTETQVGRFVNTFARIGVALASGGVAAKAAKGVLGAQQVVTGVKALDKVDELGKFWNALWKVKGAPLADDLAAVAGKTASKGARGAAARLQNVDEILRVPMAEIGARAKQGGYNVSGLFPQWADGIRRSVGVYLDPNVSWKFKAKSLSEFLVWDAFVDFMVAGEGDVDFEETLGDVLQTFGPDWLHSLGSLTMTRAEDTALQIKAKNMLEGIAIGAVLKPFMDGVAIARYARSFRNANAREQLEILSRIDGTKYTDWARTQLEDLISRSEAPSAVRGLPPGRQGGPLVLARDAVNSARDAADAANNMNWRQANVREVIGGPLGRPTGEVGVVDLGTRPPDAERTLPGIIPGRQPGPGQLPGQQPTGLIEPGEGQIGYPGPEQPVPGQLPGQQPPAGLIEPGEGQIGQPGPERPMLTQGRRLPPGAVPAPPEPPIEPVRVVPLREPEPTVTPQTFRAGLEQAIRDAYRQIEGVNMFQDVDGVFRDAETLIKEMLPRTRADMIEYIRQYAPLRGTSGSLDPADNIWWTYTLRTGMAEGWVSLDPNTFGVRYNRTVAALLDGSDEAIEAAALRSQAQDIAEVPIDVYQTEELLRQQNETNPPIDVAETEKLAEAEMQPRPVEEPDLGAQIAADEAARAEERMLSAEQEELLRIGENTEPLADMSDEDLVRRLLGLELDSVPSPIVERVNPRRWEVYDENGEYLAGASTKKAADKIANQEKTRRRDAIIARARTIANEAKDQDVSFAYAAEAAPSPSITSEVRLTAAQINALASIPNMATLRNVLDRVGPLRPRQTVPVNLNMQQMDSVVRSLDRIIESGQVSGRDLRVIRNVQTKFREELSRLNPEARAQNWAEDRARQAIQMIERGEICDWANL